ncbi:hypothetical protein XA68_15217 [Ophiocordyceps unilateralis]|uniref:Peptidase S8/S53 domain-containing protein n=1 Tax=Ophiocordyceps unilateralis TaxID=268505 RepID=A0A2A9P8K1_OPHUN|nr:hypothetical protein XA68_15217 [Ophiocordyceps unilateralis]
MIRSLTFALSVAAAAAATTTTTTTVSGAGEQPAKDSAWQRCMGQDMYLVEIDAGAGLDDVLGPVEASLNATRCRTMDFPLFKGASIQVPGHRADQAAVLAQLQTAAGVREASVVEVLRGPAVEEKGSVEEWLGKEEKRAVVKRDLRWKNETGNGTRDETANMNKALPAHILAQVDLLHQEGYTGKGVKIALIDSGIDWTHPALGGCFGPECLVSFGADLLPVNQHGLDPADQKPDASGRPMDCAGHGTMVAGIVAAQRANNSLGFGGVAPDVTLGMYKVVACNFKLPSASLVEAIYQAQAEKADIISISVEEAKGWASVATARAVARVVASGVHVVVAAGNSGFNGMFDVHAPAVAQGAVAVANVVSPSVPELRWRATYAVDGGDEVEFDLLRGPGDGDWDVQLELDLHAPSLFVDEAGERDTDACSGLSKPPRDSVVLVGDSGDCPLRTKAVEAKSVSRFMLVVGNRTALESYVPGLAVGAVSAELGDAWMRALADGKTVALHNRVVGLDESPNGAAGSVNDVSTWGPDYDLNLKPDLGAPGGPVPAPAMGGGYIVTSGTSFATPFVAGVMALIIQARGNMKPEEMLSLLSATARPLRFHDGPRGFVDGLAPAAQQGAGLIQARDAVRAAVAVSPAAVSFNDTSPRAEEPPRRVLKLENRGNDTTTYTLSYTSALTVYATNASTTVLAQFSSGDLETAEAGAALSFSQESVKLAPGQAATVEVTARLPQGLDERRLPLWSGWVVANGSDGSSLRVPCLGLAAPLRSHVLIRDEDVKIASDFSPPHQIRWSDKGEVFHLSREESPGAEKNSGPIVVVRPSLGVPQLKIVAMSLNRASLRFEPLELPGMPVLRLTGRNDFSYGWNGTLADGSMAPEGLYHFRVSALRIFGDAANEGDWDLVRTSMFKMQYPVDVDADDGP